MNESQFQVHLFDYIENYDSSEEMETAQMFFNNVKHDRGLSHFVPNLIYREYLLNRLKNDYTQMYNIPLDLNVYCRIFDINIIIYIFMTLMHFYYILNHFII